MLTLESIKKERPNDSDANIMAFLRFAKCFDCLDALTYEEALTRLALIFDDLRRADRLRDAACIVGLLMLILAWLIATIAFFL